MARDKTKKIYNEKILVLVVGLLLIGTYDCFIGGNARFYAKWISCGQRPVTTNPTLLLAGHVQYYDKAPPFSLVRMSPEYFCTPLEAEQAGYSASKHEYQFPNMQKLQRENES